MVKLLKRCLKEYLIKGMKRIKSSNIKKKLPRVISIKGNNNVENFLSKLSSLMRVMKALKLFPREN